MTYGRYEKSRLLAVAGSTKLAASRAIAFLDKYSAMGAPFLQYQAVKIVMKPRRLIAAFVFCLALASFGCDTIDRLTATSIKEILDHPRDYENKEVTIYGTVTDARSLLIVKYFEVQDETGMIKVITDRLLPAKGESIKVIGRTGVIEVGWERWVMIRETSKPEKSEKMG